MRRIDIVYNKLKEISKDNGKDAQSLAEVLGLSRANVSSELNRLCEMGLVRKTIGRPVLYAPMDNIENQSKSLTTLDKLLKDNKSLKTAGEQAKAAILYPPKGMHTLILGDTGVGKTMFAGIMHKYAMEMDKMPKDSPFITFNCADYSSNPQLIISQLFGVKKGAYTGADSDKQGLIEKANGGILFLDEVHRLPSEGQEMFFTFMDKGIFRRLGETDIERRAKVLIISATTENPESSLLKTFTRRIPMVIRIPSLNERGIEERFTLITNFFKEESYRLDRDIMVSVNSMRALLSYACQNNVGQLRTDIQLACAKAYADLLSLRKNEVKINSPDLPNYIREGLYKEIEHRQLWNKLLGINNHYCIFSKNEGNFIFDNEKNEENIYELIDYRVSELKNRGIDGQELEDIMEKDIENYFDQYFHGVNTRLNKGSLVNIVDAVIIEVVEEIIKYCEMELNRVFSQRVYLGLAIHIEASVERIRKNKKIINPQLHKIRTENNREFNAALECLKIIEKRMDISMPIDEAGFLTMFFILDREPLKNNSDRVGIIVIAHGNSTASSMAGVANELLGVELAVGINAPLDESPKSVLLRLKEYVRSTNNTKGFVLLVDMGSLSTFGEVIMEEFNVQVRVIQLVSTLHVIEAVRKSVLGFSVDQIYSDVNKIGRTDEIEDEMDKPLGNSKYVIITACTTGGGSAIAIQKFLQSHLKFDNRIFEVIPINIIGKDDINQRIKKIERDKEIICIVSPFHLNTSIPQYGLEEVLSLKAIKSIQEVIDVQNTYLKMGETLKHHLKNIDSMKVFEDIKNVVKQIEVQTNNKILTDVIIGIVLHIGCMIDRLKGSGVLVEYEKKGQFIKNNQELYRCIKSSMDFLDKKYEINITDDEICFIMNFFNTDSDISNSVLA